jgi:hypothetical protein
MKTIRVVLFWLVAISASVLYGAMYMGRFAMPMSFDPLPAILEHYMWIPSFLAGFALGRRGALLGALTVIGGFVAEPYFHDLWLRGAIRDDWDSELANLMQGVLAVCCAVVSGIAGVSLSPWRSSSNKPLEPTR